ncbi:MAG: tRNA (adenosine(37)-N6)-dimethylallyltransferase MiaA [Vicinamibacteria bacterium]|nr:tRNA (adenosine(37)-N6)-dimethylallyltransferase MiaA [Vicinamibacteria bacterium]
MRAQRIVAVVGPTASGKSDLAMDLALRLGGEIVSCDSVQVYRGLDIGSGKPSAADRARVPHHLIDILDTHEEMNAALFASLASAAISEISGRGQLPIVTGGTGLYLTALLRGLFEQGASDPSVRRRLEALAERHGPARLHRLLAHRDPEYAKRTQPRDRVRIVRALEVCFAQGRPFTRAQQERRPAYSGDALIVGLHPGREELRQRVTARVAGMIGRGLVEETRRTLERAPKGGPMPRPLGAIGYREAAASIASGGASAVRDDELQRAIVTSTMQYAKRQMTYFRRQFDVEWFAESAAAAKRVAGWVAGQDMGKQE